jgi:hypothetical protein
MAGMQPKFQAQVESNGLLIFRSPDVVRNYLISTFKNRFINVSFDLVRKTKTQSELGWYYGGILPTIHKRLIDLGYTIEIFGRHVPINRDNAHQIIKQFCARFGPDGRIYSNENYPNAEVKDVHNMDRNQISQFIHNAIAWGNNRLQCNIPEEPNVNWKSDEMERVKL